MTGLRIEELSHRFDGVTVVRGVTVNVARGEVVCLLGPSGCGKTTLLRVAAGLEKLQHGKVLIDETVVADAVTGLHLPPEQRGIGLMFQDYALFPHLNVRDNIRFGVGASTAKRRAWIERALPQMDLLAHAESYPHTLSGGQQQRVALLRALAPEPKVLFLDEPFSGLDVSRRAQVRQQTLDILKDSGVATLMVTHDPEEAMFMADRILVMNEGSVVQDGSPVEIYFSPSSEFVAGFFGPVNRLDGRVTGGNVDTPIGRFAAPGLAEGELARVLIRPEGIRLAQFGTKPAHNPGDSPCRPAPITATSEPAGDAGFRVVSARLIGSASMVAFEIPCVDGVMAVEARVPGVFLPAPGSQVSVSVNVNETHIFKA